MDRIKQRWPRVIAIRDVHGYLDKFQMLLRSCDYCLGDLVSKGLDSLLVVQKTREIEEIGVRGTMILRWLDGIRRSNWVSERGSRDHG